MDYLKNFYVSKLLAGITHDNIWDIYQRSHLPMNVFYLSWKLKDN